MDFPYWSRFRMRVIGRCVIITVGIAISPAPVRKKPTPGRCNNLRCFYIDQCESGPREYEKAMLRNNRIPHPVKTSNGKENTPKTTSSIKQHKRKAKRTALLNLNIHTSYFSHAVNYSHEYVTFWYVWNIRMTNFEILIGTSFSQMSNFRRVKNSHVLVITVKNSFEVFICVTNTCEFFTRVTGSFECESQTNLSQVWKIRTYCPSVKNSCEFFTDVTNTCESSTSMKDSHNCFTSIIRMAWHVW